MQLALPRSKIYQQRATECRSLANIEAAGLKSQYLRMAETYDLLVEQCQTLEMIGAKLPADEK